MKEILFPFIVLFSFVACNRNNGVSYVERFPEERFLDYEVLKVEQVDPWHVSFVDSLMILTEAKGDLRIHIYHREKLTLLVSYGRIGRGPGEYLVPKVLNQGVAGKNNFYIYDDRLIKIFDISVNDVLVNKYPIKRVIDLSIDGLKWGLFSHSLFFDGDYVLGENSNYGMDKKFFAFDTQKKQVRWMGADFYKKTPRIERFLKKIKNDDNPFDQGNFAQSVLAYAPAENRIVSAMLCFNRIDIMDFDFNIQKTIIYGDGVLGSTSYDNNQFERPLLLPSSFLVPYYRGINIDENIEENRKLGFEIHQYDYQGNPLRKFTIDAPVMSLYYDEQIGVIYGILHEEYTEKPLVKLNINPDYLD